MNLLRKILFPFAALYGAITELRNFLYDKQILESVAFEVPIIAVGNLSVGGTGKSPQIEYLIRLLSVNYNVATLSRGYKRKSNGFVLANSSSTAEILGDEPFQFYKKFANIKVAVDADRVNGINKLLATSPKPDVILLDDAYQHRRAKAGFYILLTAYGDLYVDDFLLPTGNLREGRKGANRADIIVVTKCPRNLSDEAQGIIRLRFNLNPQQQLFFTYIDYDEDVYGQTEQLSVTEIQLQSKVLIAGIAKPKSFFDFLKSDGDLILEFPDHHAFTTSDITKIESLSENIPIVTTEKDYVRLQPFLPDRPLYYLPIKSSFLTSSEQFNQTILNYVGQSTAHR